jgi:redox-regulated HSP33 family molecular chaperone
MVQDGLIQVTCEFCNSSYDFKPEDVQTAAPGSEQSE